MAEAPKRIGALIAAIIFLVASLASSIAVIYVLAKGDNSNTNSNTQSDTTSQIQQESETNSLIGTKLPNFTPDANVTALKVVDTTVGNGAEVKPDSTVTVTYTGALAADGTVFDASGDAKPITFPLNQVIKGWQEGLVGMRVGGTRQLWIPAADAYGDQSPSQLIPANSALFFEVTLKNVQ